MANFTEAAILDSFGRMLDKVSFEKITVSAIIKDCDISRNTFYYHFQDIYALLDAWLAREFGKFENPAEALNWEDNVKVFLNHCKANKRKVYHIAQSVSRDRIEWYVFSSTDDVIRQFIQNKAAGRNIPQDKINALSDICRYAIIGYFIRFLWNRMEDDIDSSVDRLAVVFNDILDHELS